MVHPDSFFHPSPARRAFTLIEILVVVVIISILAMVVIPKLVNAADQARESAIRTSLRQVRAQLVLYKEEHGGSYPDVTKFEAQVTLASNADGQTAPPNTAGYPFGPYLTQMPRNVATNGKTVGDGDVGTSDWYYDAATGEFRANDSVESRTW